LAGGGSRVAKLKKATFASDTDRAAHLPNEHITVDYCLQGIKRIAAAFGEFAATRAGRDDRAAT
jgi:hypothetical protein